MGLHLFTLTESLRTPSRVNTIKDSDVKMESRVSIEQLEILLDHLTSHPGLAKGYGLGGRSKETTERLWNDLAVKLNAVGSGTSKTSVQWKRYWIDLKHKAKSKASMLRREHSATGGGPSQQKPLSETFQKVLSIIGEEAACGDTQYRVPVFDIEQIHTSQPTPRRQLFPSTETPTVLSPSRSCQLPENREIHSPSTHGHTTVILDCPDAECIPMAVNRPTLIESQDFNVLTANSPQSQPRSSNTRSGRRTNLRSDKSWVIDLERRRIEAEERISEAVKTIAEAAKIAAQAALIQAEASQEQVKVIADLVQILKNKNI